MRPFRKNDGSAIFPGAPDKWDFPRFHLCRTTVQASNLRGLRPVPAKWHCLVPHTVGRLSLENISNKDYGTNGIDNERF